MKILEKDQTNTRIYIGYALALSELEGSYSKSAKKVLDMALESSSRSQSSQKSSFSSLVLNEVYVAKAGLELKYGQSDNALWTFSLMASNRYVCSTYVFIDLFHKKNREILLHNWQLCQICHIKQLFTSNWRIVLILWTFWICQSLQ